MLNVQLKKERTFLQGFFLVMFMLSSTLAFAHDYANDLLAIDVNLNTTEMLDVAWSLFGKYFRPEEVNMKKELVDEFWPKANN